MKCFQTSNNGKGRVQKSSCMLSISLPLSCCDFMPFLEQNWWLCLMLVAIHLPLDHIPEVFRGSGVEIGLVMSHDWVLIWWSNILLLGKIVRAEESRCSSRLTLYMTSFIFSAWGVQFSALLWQRPREAYTPRCLAPSLTFCGGPVMIWWYLKG